MKCVTFKQIACFKFIKSSLGGGEVNKEFTEMANMTKNDYDEIKLWYNKQAVEKLAKDRWFDDMEVPLRLMDKFSKMNEGERDEFM